MLLGLKGVPRVESRAIPPVGLASPGAGGGTWAVRRAAVAQRRVPACLSFLMSLLPPSWTHVALAVHRSPTWAHDFPEQTRHSRSQAA